MEVVASDGNCVRVKPENTEIKYKLEFNVSLYQIHLFPWLKQSGVMIKPMKELSLLFIFLDSPLTGSSSTI